MLNGGTDRAGDESYFSPLGKGAVIEPAVCHIARYFQPLAYLAMDIPGEFWGFECVPLIKVCSLDSRSSSSSVANALPK